MIRIASVALLAWLSAQEIYQIRTANTAGEFSTQVSLATSLAAVQWDLAINLGGGRQTFAGGDASAWIAGDIDTRFHGTSLVPLRDALANAAGGLDVAFIDTSALIVGNFGSSIGAAFGPLGSDTVFNTLKLTERERAGLAISELVLPRLKAFDELSKSPMVSKIGIVMAYGKKNFLDRTPNSISTNGEAVGMIMPVSALRTYIETSHGADALVDASEVYLCTQIGKCDRVRPSLP